MKVSVISLICVTAWKMLTRSPTASADRSGATTSVAASSAGPKTAATPWTPVFDSYTYHPEASPKPATYPTAGVVSEPGMPRPESHPLIAYYRGFVRERLGESGAADFEAASRMPTTYVFPNRPEGFTVLARALAANPRDATAHFLLGNLAMSGGMLDSAVAEWRRAAAIEPSIPTLHRNLGYALLSAGRPAAEARAAFEDGVRYDSLNTGVYVGLDSTLVLLGASAADRARALERFPLPDSMPASLVYRFVRLLASAGRFDDAERFVLDYLKTGFQDSQLLFLLGNMNYRRKDFDKAVGYFEQCLAQNPQSASAHNELAAIYITRDDLAKAEEHLRAALAINPRLQSLRYNMAQLLEKQNRFPEAADYYLQEIQDSPKSYKALFNLSRVYRTLGREEDEADALRKTIAANPEFPVAYFYLARIDLKRGRDFKAAIDLVKKGIDLTPSMAELPLGYFLLADLYSRVGDVVQSGEYARKGQAAAAVAASAATTAGNKH